MLGDVYKRQGQECKTLEGDFASIGLVWLTPAFDFDEGDGCHDGCIEQVIKYGPGCCETNLRGNEETESHRPCNYYSHADINYFGENAGARAVKCQGNSF